MHLPLLLSLCMLWCVEADAERAPAEQLARMSQALRSLSYQGTLVYLHENRLETLRILHQVEDGQVREELISLNGPVRTLTREKGQVTCELSSHPISVRGQGVEKDLLHAWTLDPDALGDHYRVQGMGTARVVGRHAEVVGILPRDDMRYGYHFYLDRDSGLPLKSDLLGQGPDPIEQIMFTSLELMTPPRGSTAATPRSRHGTVGLVPSKPTASGTGDGTTRAPKPVLDTHPWRFASLPPGFVLAMRDYWLDTGKQRVEHFVFSDGLASVSVYVESNPQEGLEGDTQLGAVHAAGKRVAGHQVTVVGEVPRKTVTAMVMGIRYVPHTSHEDEDPTGPSRRQP